MSAPGSEAAAGHELEALLQVMARLRDPQRGCPWDRAQNFISIAPYTIEEAYEVADAIARADLAALRDELGDLLFQVVFHARMAEEAGHFDFADVACAIRQKLVRRHPHVFAQAGPIGEPAAAATRLRAEWETHKARERAAAGLPGVLAAVPVALPALARAAKLGRRASRVGFDWPNAAGVRAKVDEELEEIGAELAGGEPHADEPGEALAAGLADPLTEELGDLLFTIANWARHLRVDPEEALRCACRKFERRFAAMERLAAARGLAIEGLSADAWDGLWSEAKAGA